LTWREEALAMWEEKAKISKRALVKVSFDLDAERAKSKATRKEYLDKMEAHTARAKHSFILDKVLGEKKVELNGREWDLGLCEAMLVEAQSPGLNPWDNREELMEFVKLQRLIKDVEVERITKAGRLAILVSDVSEVLVDHGMPPIPGIFRDPCTTDDILEVMGIILEHLWEAYASGHDRWD
jgi:hypothetical protein